MVFYATPPPGLHIEVRKAELPPHFVRLNAILDDLEAGFRSAARRAFNSFADGQKLSVIEAALRTGNMGQLMSVIDFRTLALNLGTELGPAMRAAMLKGGEEALKVVPGVVAGDFDVTNPLVVGFARDHSAQLVRELTTNTELGIRAVIGQGMGEGLLPAEMARRIRAVNGFKLTRGQTMSVNNFRAGLVETIQGDMSAAELGRRYQMSRGMLQAKQLRMANVDKLTRQYRERWFRNRAATIARQEASVAYHFGKRMGWMQAIQRGALDPAKDVRQWIATPDERTCFPEFSPVLTRQGERPISEIQPGDSVRTRYGYRKVVATHQREYDGWMVALQTKAGTLFCTSDHPVWVIESGWQKAADVEIGNHLETAAKQAARLVARIGLSLHDPRKYPTPASIAGKDKDLAAHLEDWLPVQMGSSKLVYNLQVEDEEVYYASGLLVHNCQICLPMHLQIRGFNEDFTTGEGSGVADAPAHIACRCDTIIITERRQKRRLSRPERRAQERIRIIQDQRDKARAARGLEPQFVPDPGAFPGELP